MLSFDEEGRLTPMAADLMGHSDIKMPGIYIYGKDYVNVRETKDSNSLQGKGRNLTYLASHNLARRASRRRHALTLQRRRLRSKSTQGGLSLCALLCLALTL